MEMEMGNETRTIQYIRASLYMSDFEISEYLSEKYEILKTVQTVIRKLFYICQNE